jgi:hypothetical protein
MKVALITTGEMELKGLPKALASLFPRHSFEAVEAGRGKSFGGFTVHKVPALLPTASPTLAEKLVAAALGSLFPSAPGEVGADLALILDDLELANSGNEAAVVAHVRAAALRVANGARSPAVAATWAQALRERVSLHLAVPMTESWFFGDLAGLAARVPAASPPPRLGSAPDHEQFRVSDPAYQQDQGVGCRVVEGQTQAPWLIARRDEHPKAYLSWMLRDTRQGKCTTYSPTSQGRRLLSELDWQAVLAHPNAYPYLRALVRDLESNLGPSTAPPGGVVAALTSNSGSGRVLRNI